jgi:hypothetical protein
VAGARREGRCRRRERFLRKSERAEELKMEGFHCSNSNMDEDAGRPNELVEIEVGSHKVAGMK